MGSRSVSPSLAEMEIDKRGPNSDISYPIPKNASKIDDHKIMSVSEVKCEGEDNPAFSLESELGNARKTANLQNNEESTSNNSNRSSVSPDRKSENMSACTTASVTSDAKSNNKKTAMDDIDESTRINNLPSIEKLQVYKIRWLILGLFCMYSASNSMQWIQLSIVTEAVTKYYGVSTTAVDWTSMIYMILYIPFVFPASYLLERMGLRKAVLIGMFLTCVGSWIKVAAISPDRFYVAFIGQTLVGFAQIFVLAVPARIAAVWFGPEQVSSACSIGVFGNQVGIAIGFLIPPMIVNKNHSIDEIGQELFIMFITFSIVTTVLLILILILFKRAPPTPPSYAQAIQDDGDESIDFFGSLKRLFLNRSYVLLLTAYGINTGVFYAISTLLSQIISAHYKEADEDAGRIGLVIVLTGMLGSILCGVVLDRFRAFKGTTLAVYLFSFIGMILFTFTIPLGIGLVYFVAGALGFFMTGLLPVGFELAAELTYPEPEGTSAGLLNGAANLFGIAFTNIYSWILYDANDTWASGLMAFMLFCGTILTACISSDFRRQAAGAASLK